MSKWLEIQKCIDEEAQRQEDEICLIASENYMSRDVLSACGSKFINKYAEGYSGHRYYGGCSVVDKLEDLANECARKLFNCKWSNVQPNSGCQANQAVYMALLKPNDTVLGMDINSGGHISHTLGIGFAGTFYNNHSYGLDENGYLNYDEIKEKLYKYRPSLLIVGASAYPRIIDFERVRKLVDEYNEWQKENDLKNAKLYNEGKIADLTPDSYPQYKHCYLMVDMAHIAGLVAAGLHPSPLPYADVVTSTVQKTLRSGRGGLILSNNEELGKKIDKAIFPRLQGGPLMNMIAGKAVGFSEALETLFVKYQKQVLTNVQAMVKVFNENGIKMITGGSDNHLILLDLRDEPFSGAMLEQVLEKQGIIVNKNAVQNDPKPKMETSGVRIGTAAITTRNAVKQDAHDIAVLITSNIKYLRNGGIPDDFFDSSRKWVKEWCKKHPIYPDYD
jgi:glycine hydroxymethyltransferase